MNCYECAKRSETSAAVAICQRCGVGLCIEHLVTAERFSVGGTHEGCGHKLPQANPLRARGTKKPEGVGVA